MHSINRLIKETSVDIWRFSDEFSEFIGDEHRRNPGLHENVANASDVQSQPGLFPNITPRGAAVGHRKVPKDRRRSMPRAPFSMAPSKSTSSSSASKTRITPIQVPYTPRVATMEKRASGRPAPMPSAMAQTHHFLVQDSWEQPAQKSAVDYKAVLRFMDNAKASSNTDLIHYAVEEAISSASVLCKERMYKQAEKLYKAVLDVEPEHTTALCNLGCIVERVGNDSLSAVKLFEHALQVEPNDVTCMINLARALYKMSSSIKQPRLLLRRVLAREPTNTGALVNLALLVLSEFSSASEEGRKSTVGQDAAELAETLFRQALEAAKVENNRHAKGLALGNLAALRKLASRDLDDAERLYREAIESDPSHAVLRKNLGHLYHEMFAERAEHEEMEKRGRKGHLGEEKGRQRAERGLRQLGQKAETQYRRALRLCASSGAPKELMGELLVALAGLLCEERMGGQWLGAVELLEEANVLDPSNLEAAVLFSTLLWERCGKPCQAQAVLETCMERNKQAREQHWGRLRNVVKALNGFAANAVAAVQVKPMDKPMEMSASLFFDITKLRSPENCEITCSSFFNFSLTFDATNAFDGIADTEWASDGEGTGAWVQVRYPKTYLVGIVKVRQRAFGSSAKMQHNKEVQVMMDGTETRRFQLEQNFELQALHISPPVLTAAVRIEALSVYSTADVVNNGFNAVEVWGMDGEAADMDVKFHKATQKIQRFLKLKQQFKMRREAQSSAEKADAAEVDSLDLIIASARLLRDRIQLSMPNPAQRHLAGDSIAAVVEELLAHRESPAQRQLLYEGLVALGDYVLWREQPLALRWTKEGGVRGQAATCFTRASELAPRRGEAPTRLAMMEDEALAGEEEGGAEWGAQVSRVEGLYLQALCVAPEEPLALCHYAAFAHDRLADNDTALRLYRQAEQVLPLQQAARQAGAESGACGVQGCREDGGQLRGEVLCGLGTVLCRQGLQGRGGGGEPAEEREGGRQEGGGALGEAARWLEEGRRCAPLSLPLLCNLGTLEAARGNKKAACRLYQRALHQFPGAVVALCNAATLVDDMGRSLKAARRLYETALFHDPRYQPALAGLGSVLHRQGKLAKAEAVYRRAQAERADAAVEANLQQLVQRRGGPDPDAPQAAPASGGPRGTRKPASAVEVPGAMLATRPSSRELSLLGRASRGTSSVSSHSRGRSRGQQEGGLPASRGWSRGQAEAGLFEWGGGLYELHGSADIAEGAPSVTPPP